MTALAARLFRLWPLVAAALLVRAVVPAGWMVDTGQPDSITLRICNADTVRTIPLDRDPAPQQDGKSAAPCLFAGFAGAAPLPETWQQPAMLAPPGQIRVARLAQFQLQRATREHPPGRAPPVRA